MSLQESLIQESLISFIIIMIIIIIKIIITIGNWLWRKKKYHCHNKKIDIHDLENIGRTVDVSLEIAEFTDISF